MTTKPTLTQVLYILQEARKLISLPKHWTQETLARDATGTPVSPLDPTACCWCAEGAMHHVMGSPGFTEVSWITSLMAYYTPTYRVEVTFDLSNLDTPTVGRQYHIAVYAFNDMKDTTHAQILSLFDQTIAQLEKEIADDH